MLDFLRNLTKSAEEKRQEQIHAYVSGSLSDADKRQFETQMGQDVDLRSEVDSLLQLRQAMRAMPQRRARRSFALDPAKYGKPQPQRLGQLYPMVRAATALTAVFLVIALSAEFFTMNGAPVASFPTVQQESADSVAMGAQDTAGESAVVDMMEESEAMDEEMADAEMAEEEMDDATADEAPPAEAESLELAVPENAESATESLSEDSVELAAPPPSQPTADTPRILPTPTLDTRGIESDEVLDTDADDAQLNLNVEGTAVAELDEEALLQYQLETRQADQTSAFENPTDASANSSLTSLRLAQIGLAIILVGLLMLLRAARLQR